AAAIRGMSPGQRRRRRDDLRRHRHRSDRAPREPQAAQVRREISERGADVTVIEEVGAAETRPHSRSSVHKSGNCAFEASAMVSFTLVSAISYEYTPATAYPRECACSMMLVASLSDLLKTWTSTRTTNSIG